MKKISAVMVLLAGASLLTACAPQSTPSMMNTSRPQVVSETSLKQVPVKDVTDGYLYGISEEYARYGSGGVQLFLAYDPSSKTYGAMKAFNDLSRFKESLKKMGVRGITAETVKAEGSQPILMVSFESVTAHAPAGCRNMPGFDDGLTTREVGDYRFGCSTETLIAKQIYRPSDLQGNAMTEPGDGRRAANTVEYNRRVEREDVKAPLIRIERSDIQE